MMMAARPRGSRAPAEPRIVGPTRIATPTKPTTIPTPARRGSDSPRKPRPKIATQTGIIAMSRAAMPDGIVCSPNATMPMPPPSSSAPTMSVSRHSRRLGMTKDPRARNSDQPSRTAPAIAKRTAAIRNGGIVSTAIAMPR